MKVDFEKLNSCVERYKEIIHETEKAISLLEIQIVKLTDNSETEGIICELKKNINELKNLLLLSKKMKATLIKSVEIYIKCEDELTQIIEGDSSPKFDAIKASIVFIENLHILLK